jgi:hypothetical protein
MSKLLDLSTVDPERPLIAIDGQGYEMALPEDFGLLELGRLERLRSTVSGIMARKDGFTEDDAQKMARALDEFTGMVLPSLPADVRARLRDSQRLAILEAFLQAAEARGKPLPQRAAPLKKSRTGAR